MFRCVRVKTRPLFFNTHTQANKQKKLYEESQKSKAHETSLLILREESNLEGVDAGSGLTRATVLILHVAEDQGPDIPQGHLRESTLDAAHLVQMAADLRLAAVGHFLLD